MDATGQIADPMKATLDMLDKGLSDLPRMLTTDHSALAVMAQPTDASTLSQEGTNDLVDSLIRMTGGTPEKRAG